MSKTHCRIGRVKFKTGGDLHVLKSEQKSVCFITVKNLSGQINEDTLAVGFFLVRKDRSMVTGWSYEAGTSNCDLLGGTSLLKYDIEKREVEDDG